VVEAEHNEYKENEKEKRRNNTIFLFENIYYIEKFYFLCKS